MQELQIHAGTLAAQNAAFVHILAAIAKQQPGGKLVVTKEMLESLGSGDVKLGSETLPNGDIIFQYGSAAIGNRPPDNVIPLEGLIHNSGKDY